MHFGMLTAQVCEIVGLACLDAFIVEGKQNEDGQGVNSVLKKDWE